MMAKFSCLLALISVICLLYNIHGCGAIGQSSTTPETTSTMPETTSTMPETTSTMSGQSPTTPETTSTMPGQSPISETTSTQSTVESRTGTIQPLACPLFNVAYGNVFYNAATISFQVTCTSGYELKGNSMVLCLNSTTTGKYSVPFPQCHRLDTKVSFHLMHHKTILALDLGPRFASPIMPFKTVPSLDEGNCAWMCAMDQRCLTAEMNRPEGTCDLYDASVYPSHYAETMHDTDLLFYA